MWFNRILLNPVDSSFPTVRKISWNSLHHLWTVLELLLFASRNNCRWRLRVRSCSPSSKNVRCMRIYSYVTMERVDLQRAELLEGSLSRLYYSAGRSPLRRSANERYGLLQNSTSNRGWAVFRSAFGRRSRRMGREIPSPSSSWDEMQYVVGKAWARWASCHRNFL